MANDAPPVFDDRVIRLIVASLPKRVDPRRLELLPQVLREWSSNELLAHLSREPPAVVKERAERVKAVGDRARDLLKALEAIDDVDQWEIADKMLREEEHLRLKMMVQRIKEEKGFLIKLAAAAPKAWKRRRGHPPNDTAYLVMKDAAAIFEWCTKSEAKREVDRVSHEEIGPFFQFVVAIWPVIFGKGDDGVSATIKKWASYRKLEGRPLIANIAMRHRTWRLFED
jgi:hypothetical protein